MIRTPPVEKRDPTAGYAKDAQKKVSRMANYIMAKKKGAINTGWCPPVMGNIWEIYGKYMGFLQDCAPQ